MARIGHWIKGLPMMVQRDTDEIFREVDEELRKEKFEQLWKDYGTYIAVAALVVVLGVGGWKFSEYLQAKRSAEAGARFNAVLLQLESKKTEDAEKALREISGSSQGGYRALARMKLAALDQASGKADEAVKAYDGIAADTGVDGLMRGLASIKSAMLRIDAADWTEMQNRLTPLKVDKNPWQLSARELLGLSAWKAGRVEDAEAEYLALIGKEGLPQGMKQRVEVMLALILDAKNQAKADVTPAVAAPATAATAAPQAAPKEQPSPKDAGAKGKAPAGVPGKTTAKDVQK